MKPIPNLRVAASVIHANLKEEQLEAVGVTQDSVLLLFKSRMIEIKAESYEPDDTICDTPWEAGIRISCGEARPEAQWSDQEEKTKRSN